MHFVNQCEYGYTHGQCRCFSKDKSVRMVKCDQISHAENSKNQNALRDKIAGVLEPRMAIPLDPFVLPRDAYEAYNAAFNEYGGSRFMGERAARPVLAREAADAVLEVLDLD